MTAARIAQLLRGVPSDILPKFEFNTKRSVSPYIPWPDDDCDRFAICYSDPAFGFKFVRTLVQHDLPLPAQLDGDDEILFRAYLYLCNPGVYRDELVIGALAMTAPAMRSSESKLQALLVAKDATPERVGAILGLPPRFVRTYELLFFNILDRKDDAMYLNQLIFPNGRIDEYFDSYLEGSSMRSLMMRSGIDNGIDEAAFMGGFNRSLVDGISAAQSAKQLEAIMMAQGYIMARNGWHNQSRNAQALTNARSLIQAGKIGGTETSGGQSEMVYMANVMWGEMQTFQKMRMQHAAKVRDGQSTVGFVVESPRDFAQVAREQQSRDAALPA